MNIGVDLDGVVFDTESHFRAYADHFNYLYNNYEFLDKLAPRLQKRYNWNEDLKQKFFDEYLLRVHLESPLCPLAKEILATLRAQGHKLIAITNRGNVDPREVEITHQRCEKDGIKFDKLHFFQENKLPICQEEKIDIMLEDYYDNVKQLSENGIPCIYFRYFYEKCDNPNVYEVQSWGQVLPTIDEIVAKKQ